MIDTIKFKLNDKPLELKVDGERRLLWVLRSDLGLTGTKYGCGEGICGACTVLINKKATRSCQVTVKDIKGKEVITIEGLAEERTPPPPPKSLHGPRCPPMWFLYLGDDPECLQSTCWKNLDLQRRRSSRAWMITCAAVEHMFGSSRLSRVRLRR